MKKLTILFLLILMPIFFTYSCQRVSTSTEGKLKSIILSDLKGIPLEYGSLISVTTHASYPGWAQLWFEDDDRTIRLVRIGFGEDRVHEKVLVIPR